MIKRISVALEAAMNELVESNSVQETIDLNSTLILLKKPLSKTNVSSEIRTFKKFIALLSNLRKI